MYSSGNEVLQNDMNYGYVQTLGIKLSEEKKKLQYLKFIKSTSLELKQSYPCCPLSSPWSSFGTWKMLAMMEVRAMSS